MKRFALAVMFDQAEGKRIVSNFGVGFRGSSDTRLGSL